MRELGYVEGKNYVIEARWTEQRADRLVPLARELVNAKVDLIVTHGFPAGRALKAATSSIPIVVAVVSDITPLVDSLSRPGYNLTGLTDSVADLSPKEVQLLKETLPGLTRVGILWARRNPATAKMAELSQMAAAKSNLEVRLLSIDTIDDIDGVLELAVKGRVGAVIVIHEQTTVGNRQAVAEALLRHRLPSVAGSTWLADAGVLLGYSPDQSKMFKRSAGIVDKIFKGAKPADIPVEQPTEIDLVINLKTARALGLTIPSAMLLRATRVIE